MPASLIRIRAWQTHGGQLVRFGYVNCQHMCTMNSHRTVSTVPSFKIVGMCCFEALSLRVLVLDASILHPSEHDMCSRTPIEAAGCRLLAALDIPEVAMYSQVTDM